MKNKKNLVYILIGLIIGLIIGYILCYSILQENRVDVEVLTQTSIHLDGELQVARTESGKKLYPLKYENHLYIPVTRIGYMLNDKEVQVKENSVDLNTVKVFNNVGYFETESLNGEPFTDENIKENKFTVVFNWATWCPYCKEDLVELERVYKHYEAEGVKIIGLLVDVDYEEAKKLVKDMGVTFDIVKTNNNLRNRLQTNMNSIPEFLILNNEGEIVTDDINGEHNILLLKNRLDELIIEECSKCSEE